MKIVVSLLAALQEFNAAFQRARNTADEVKSAYYEWYTNRQYVMYLLQSLKQDLQSSTDAPTTDVSLTEGNSLSSEAALVKREACETLQELCDISNNDNNVEAEQSDVKGCEASLENTEADTNKFLGTSSVTSHMQSPSATDESSMVAHLESSENSDTSPARKKPKENAINGKECADCILQSSSNTGDASGSKDDSTGEDFSIMDSSSMEDDSSCISMKQERPSHPNNGLDSSTAEQNRIQMFRQALKLMKHDETLTRDLLFTITCYYGNCGYLFNMMAKMQGNSFATGLRNELTKHLSLELNFSAEGSSALSSALMLLSVLDKMDNSPVFKSIQHYISATKRNLRVVIMNSSALYRTMICSCLTEHVALCSNFLGFQTEGGNTEAVWLRWIHFVKTGCQEDYTNLLLLAIFRDRSARSDKTRVIEHLDELEECLQASLDTSSCVEEMLLVDPYYEAVVLMR